MTRIILISKKSINELFVHDIFKNLRNMSKIISKHCFKCKGNQTKKHKSYENLQSIFIFFVFFYVITIDFVLTMFVFHIDINCVMSIICKFSKRITSMLEIFT